MRIISKFAGSLLIGIGGVLVIDAAYSVSREVSFLENDMRLDHLILGQGVAWSISQAWRDQGKEAAARIPHAIEQGDRHLELALIEESDAGSAWQTIAPEIQTRLRRGHTASIRGVDQRTLIPITGPNGEVAALAVSEPLTDVQSFARGSLLQRAIVTVVAILVCASLAFALGFVWVGRPIRLLCEGARRIGRGDLTGGLRIEGNSEFTLLANEMNAMCRALATAHDDVARESSRRIEALEQLRHADRLATVGKLAAGIAHELGTPLNVVSAHASMIAAGEVTGDEVDKSANAIAAQAERMTVIIRHLLDFARPRSAVKTPTDLVGLARQTLAFLEPAATKRGVRLGFVGDVASVVAVVDPTQLQQVLTNLFVNAIQATTAGGSVEVDVAQVHAEPPPDHGGAKGRWARIDVRDTGAGIAADDLPHLFEPFFTTKGVGEGTGLGLSVSLGMVKENGGWITVASQSGRGSCFSVFLPAYRAL